MGRDDARVLEPLEQAEQAAARPRVEPARGLVHDEDARLHGEDGGDRDRPLLAAGEAVGRALREVLRADAREGLRDPRPHVLGREPEVQRPEAHILGDGRHEQLVVRVLEDHADRPADVGQRVLCDRDAADVDGAVRRRQQAVQVQQQRGLAGAVGADDGDRLAVPDLEGDALERLRPVGVGEAQVADADGVVAHPLSPVTRRPTASGTSTRRNTTKAADQASVKTRSAVLKCSRRATRISPSKPRHFIAR